MSEISFRAAEKRFGSTRVLTELHLTIAPRSITAILGPSGSGKTTLLRLIAGFESLDGGELAIAGRVVDDGRRCLRPQQRGVGYVPQEGALFPHLTVLGNIAFGIARAERDRARELARLVGLAELTDRYPHQLSGGQQQRVALARALAVRPQVVLLDEPFGSLDASLRHEVRDDVARILRESGTTAILVTHDQDEALAVADEIALLGDGRVIAQATPRELYRDPPTAACAHSVGEANILAGEIRAGRAHCALGELAVRGESAAPAAPPEGRCQLLLRPEQITLRGEAHPGLVPARVQRLQYHGHETLVRVDIQTGDRPSVIARVAGGPTVAVGQDAWVQVVGSALAWPADG